MSKILSPNITKNFKFYEFVTTSNAQYADENYQYGQDNYEKIVTLAKQMQKVRDLVGHPIIISSAVRCPGLNKAVGGAKNSQHVKCEAVDFIVVVQGSNKSILWEVFKKIRTSAVDFDQLIYEVRGKSEWIHISFCEIGRRECLTFDGKKYTKINPKEVL